YCAILGFLTVKESVPFSIKMGATRKKIGISLGLFCLGLSLIKAVAASITQILVDLLNAKAGIDTLMFLHLAYFTDDRWLQRICIARCIMFFILSVLLVI